VPLRGRHQLAPGELRDGDRRLDLGQLGQAVVVQEGLRPHEQAIEPARAIGQPLGLATICRARSSETPRARPMAS
jgi:hypothetical protein